MGMRYISMRNNLAFFNDHLQMVYIVKQILLNYPVV